MLPDPRAVIHVRAVDPGPGTSAVRTPLHERDRDHPPGTGSKADRTDRPATRTLYMDTVKTEVPTSTFKIAENTWGAKKTKLMSQFSQLTDTDLSFVEGQEREFSTRLQTKLGKSEAEVQQLINEL